MIKGQGAWQGFCRNGTPSRLWILIPFSSGMKGREIINLRLCPVRDPSPAPPMDADFSSLFSFFALSLCACRFEVTVTSVSLPPFVSPRGLFNTNQRLSRCVQAGIQVDCATSLCGCGTEFYLKNPTHREPPKRPNSQS